MTRPLHLSFHILILAMLDSLHLLHPDVFSLFPLLLRIK